MADIPTDKKFAVLCEIVRAQHFAWRQAMRQIAPDVPSARAVEAMWRVTGEQTADAYARRIDRSKPMAPQVAAAIEWSSRCMGEDAAVEAGNGPDEAYLRHHACPWLTWHQKQGALAEDRPGCDAWFAGTVDALNRRFGTRLRFETLQALPDGDPSCLRRIWNEG